MVAVIQRFLGRLDDVLGRREIGLADAEVDDVPALGLQLLGPGQDLKRALGADPRHALGELQGDLLRP